MNGQRPAMGARTMVVRPDRAAFERDVLLQEYGLDEEGASGQLLAEAAVADVGLLRRRQRAEADRPTQATPPKCAA